MTDVRIVVAAQGAGLAAEAGRCLTRLGYAVIGLAASGQDAVRLATEARPDLALLDIALRGPVDGPAAAARIRRQLGLPVVLLVPTAAALDQALAAEPDGLAFMPLEPAGLRAAVEFALARRRAEDALRREAGRLAATLDGMADAVLAADAQGRVTYLNAAAELLTGHTREDARGQPAARILDLWQERTGQPITDPVRWARGQGRAPGRAWLQTRDGDTLSVGVTVGCVMAEPGEADGAVLVLRVVSAAADGSSPPRLHMPALPHGTETILLAGGEGMLRNLNRRILQLCGYEVLEARDAAQAEAVSAAHAGQIHLLVAESRMSRVSGPELAQSLAGRRPGLRALFLSGAAEDDAASLSDGAPLLAKPYSVTELARKVRELLDAGAGQGPQGPVTP